MLVCCICVTCGATDSELLLSSCVVCRPVGFVSGVFIDRVESCCDGLGCVMGVVFCDVVLTTFSIMLSI